MTVDVDVYDNTMPEDFRAKVLDYINAQEWIATWKPFNSYATFYTPETETFMKNSHKHMTARAPHMFMHRCGLAREEDELKEKHPIIGQLWDSINSTLGNRYELKGPPEGIAQLEHPSTPYESDDRGWRVYCNGQLDETIKRSHGVHKDTKDLTDPYTRTILYVANLVWYPTWFAECVYYPDDVEGITGDRQQYHTKFGVQSRDFPVGWAEKIVSPVPGRIISYDGRTLHTTRPTAVWAEGIRKVIAFRARLKPEFQEPK